MSQLNCWSTAFISDLSSSSKLPNGFYKTLENLEQITSLERLADRLLTEELQRSQEAYEQLLRTIEQKRQP
jgi:hypothetical protein